MTPRKNFALPSAGKILRGLTATALIAACVVGCGTAAHQAPTPAPSSPETTTSTSALTVSGAWVKAMSSQADHAMTGAFMVLTNPTDKDITIAAAHSDHATMVELHETVMDNSGTTVMQEIPGGLVVPAHGERILEPGKEHVMLMGLTKDVVAGDSLTIELSLANGEVLRVQAMARDFDGAQETYSHEETSAPHNNHQPDSEHSDSHDSGSHDSGSH